MTRRKALIAVLIILPVLMLAGFFLAPEWVAQKRNRVAGSADIAVSDAARALHRELHMADLHADALLWRRDLTERGEWGHVDIPRLLEGRVAVQTFSVVTRVPYGLNSRSTPRGIDAITPLVMAQAWPPRTWTSLLERALYQAEKLHRFARESGGRLRIIKNRKDLAQLMADRRGQVPVTSGLLALEGAHALEGEVAHVATLKDAGYRMIAPTHFFDTAISGSAHGVEKYGLTALGRDWVAAMDRHEMIIDLAHASDKAVAETLALTNRPVVVSHTGLDGHCDNARNLSDELAKAVASEGGLIGIGFWPMAVCGTGLTDVADAIAYAVSLLGEDHVALGSDFDGAVQSPIDASHMDKLVQALMNKGLSETAIEKVMGQNTLRFLQDYLPEQ